MHTIINEFLGNYVLFYIPHAFLRWENYFHILQRRNCALYFIWVSGLRGKIHHPVQLLFLVAGSCNQMSSSICNLALKTCGTNFEPSSFSLKSVIHAEWEFLRVIMGKHWNVMQNLADLILEHCDTTLQTKKSCHARTLPLTLLLERSGLSITTKFTPPE